MPSILLTPLRVRGRLVAPTRLFPGPMENVTEGAWVESLTRHGWVRCWWMPFLRISTAVPRLGRLRARLAPYCQTGLPVIAQVMGTDCAKVAESAACFASLDVAMVDLNCACPMPAIVRKGSGGALLRNPSWIRDTLREMRRRCGPGRPISVKLRMGWERPEEFEEAIAPMLLEAAPDVVTLHFRTVQEQYRPVANGWQRFRKAREILRGIPLIASGDLFTIEDIRRAAEEFGMDGVAPARGMLRNPRLLWEAEETLAGRQPLPFSFQERETFLQEIRTLSAPGFTLQLAANFYGKDSKEFHRWRDTTLV